MPDQKYIYILWQSQTFCARQKDDLISVKLFFVPAQNILGPVKGQGISEIVVGSHNPLIVVL